MTREKILIVDDEHLQRWAIQEKLKRWGYEVSEAADVPSTIDQIKAELPDVILLDLKLGTDSGLDLLQTIKNIDSTSVVIMITAHGVLDDAVAAFRLGLFDFLSKPIDFTLLRTTLRHAFETRRLRAEVKRWRDNDRAAGGDAIVGSAPSLQAALDTAKRVAASGATTVLLQGESGTGKDMFARAIHYGSARAERPLVAVNCAALPEALLETELLGHERGAFTDASAMKKGLLEMADGGTLYLDEVGDLKLGLQAKLLRMFETMTFRRIGAVKDTPVDVRVIAASNRRLDQAVAAGEFRPDLFYRLSVIKLHLPPLRDRRSDIPLLVRHFVAEYNGRMRKSVKGVTPAAMRRLMAYHWPGNVRELRNAIERAMILEEGDEITVEPLHLQDPSSEAENGFVLPPGGASLAAVEHTLIHQALARAGGNQSQAARMLNISRDTLRYKVKKLAVGSGDSQIKTALADDEPA